MYTRVSCKYCDYQHVEFENKTADAVKYYTATYINRKKNTYIYTARSKTADVSRFVIRGTRDKNGQSAEVGQGNLDPCSIPPLNRFMLPPLNIVGTGSAEDPGMIYLLSPVKISFP